MTSTLWLSFGCLILCATADSRSVTSEVPRDAAPAASASPATMPGDDASRVGAIVDPRVELMSIIARLAGYEEYRERRSESAYSRDVDAHFQPFADHPAIAAARELRRKRSVGYDAVISMAVHISDAVEVKEAVPFDRPGIPLDGRWRPKEARDFLDKARAFVREADFKSFFDAHQELYAAAAANLTRAVGDVDLQSWFDAYFGTRAPGEFRLVVGMLTGGGSYGCRFRRPDGSLEMYSVIGAWQFNRKGVPSWPPATAMTVVHECGHSYCNPLADRHMAKLREAGDKLLKSRTDQMTRQAYGTGETVIYETLVRTVCARYAYATKGEMAGRLAAQHEANRGFVWVGELSDLLAEYEANRERYPTLEAFMPRVVAFVNGYADRAEIQPSGKPGWLDRVFSTSRPAR